MKIVAEKSYRDVIDQMIYSEFASYADFERTAGINRGTIRKIVNGDRRMSESMAYRIGAASWLDPYELLRSQADFYYDQFLAGKSTNTHARGCYAADGRRVGAGQNQGGD